MKKSKSNNDLMPTHKLISSNDQKFHNTFEL